MINNKTKIDTTANLEIGQQFYYREIGESYDSFTVYTVKKVYTVKDKTYADFSVEYLENHYNAVHPTTGQFLKINEYLANDLADIVKATIRGGTIYRGISKIDHVHPLTNQLDKYTIIRQEKNEIIEEKTEENEESKMKTKIVSIGDRKFEIIKPEDIHAEMKKSEDQGYHVSDWAWFKAKYIARDLETGEEMWLAYNYLQQLADKIAFEEHCKRHKVENIIEENKDSYYLTVYTGAEEDLTYHAPLHPTENMPNYSAYNEIMLESGYWSYLKNRIARRYEIDTDFGESGDKKRIRIYI